MLARALARTVYRAQERAVRRPTFAYLRRLEQSQWLGRTDLEALQHDRLHQLLGLAWAHCPWHRRRLEAAGLSPEDLGGLHDLERLPCMTKHDAAAHHAELVWHGVPGGTFKYNTGGSSGEPLIFYIGRERVSHDVAAKWRATRWWDVDIGDREIVVWGSPIELGAQDRVRQLRDALMRTELMPAFDMSEARLDEFIARIRSRRPAMMFGYPSSISLLADHAARRGVRLDDLGTRVVFVTSERLYDHQRETIESAFGCPVANGYGGRDAGFIAHQCPSGSMHLTAEDIVVEIVDRQGRVLPAGEAGEIVVTHLATSEFPFIRYRTGDVGMLSEAPCGCGRGLPVLREIQGRSTDFVVAADGTIMHGLALIYVMRDIPSISEFKVVQESRTLTRVYVQPGETYSEADGNAIVAGMRARLGGEVEIQVEVVGSIPAERSGKFRYVVSKVAA